MKRSDEPPAFRAGAIDHLHPLMIAQIQSRQDGSGHRYSICGKGVDELDRQLRSSDRSGGSGTHLRIDDYGVTAELAERELRRRRGKAVGASEQLNELAPADGTVVRIGGWLG